MQRNGKTDHASPDGRAAARRSADGTPAADSPLLGDPTSTAWLIRLLVHTIRYALRQEEAATALRSLALTDELTGLYNRRGFLLLARQQMKIAKRNGRGLLVVVADLDGLKQINDSHGHYAGDQVLREAAMVLKRTFRDSDIVGRVGGDEFAALANDAPDPSGRAIEARLQDNLRAHNQGSRSVRVSLSVGMAACRADHSTSLDDLIDQADRTMYSRRQSRTAP